LQTLLNHLGQLRDFLKNGRRRLTERAAIKFEQCAAGAFMTIECPLPSKAMSAEGTLATIRSLNLSAESARLLA